MRGAVHLASAPGAFPKGAPSAQSELDTWCAYGVSGGAQSLPAAAAVAPRVPFRFSAPALSRSGSEVSLTEISSGNEYVAYDTDLLPGLAVEAFDPDYLRVQNLLIGTQSSPRGTAWVFKWRERVFLLRHYRRGGALSRLLHDRYVWLSRARTRPAREWRMLGEMRARGLPVPAPAAWRLVRCGPILYRADFIFLLIPGCETLHRYLHEREMPEEGWRRLGATLRRFHDFQIRHPDLTAGNVLVDEKGCFHLVDFDRARQRQGQRWKVSNLDRLRRSLRKQHRLDPTLHYGDERFRALKDGYRAAS